MRAVRRRRWHHLRSPRKKSIDYWSKTLQICAILLRLEKKFDELAVNLHYLQNIRGVLGIHLQSGNKSLFGINPFLRFYLKRQRNISKYLKII